MSWKMGWASLTVLTKGCGHFIQAEVIQNSRVHQVDFFWTSQLVLIVGVLAIESNDYSYSLKSMYVNICMLTYKLILYSNTESSPCCYP